MNIRKEAFPHRYEAIECLGAGGAGEVWSVRDRYTQKHYALKILSAHARDGETASLIREATALSGLEGLGVPRVMLFGKLPDSSRLFLLRELVEGESLEALQKYSDRRQCLIALAEAADKITRLHRTDLLHGDIKPANIIVSPKGGAHLVDLGLAEACQDGGSLAHGSTPRYAAPELLTGGRLTIRAEIHALGVTLRDLLEGQDRGSLSKQEETQLQSVERRATHRDPTQRYPSADEFAAALRGALQLRSPSVPPVGNAPWPVCGIESVAAQLLAAAKRLSSGELLFLQGPNGSGRSVLLRHLAWSLGVEGRALVWLDDQLVGNDFAVASELSAVVPAGVLLLVDDYARLSETSAALVEQARAGGAMIVAAGTEPECPTSRTETFDVPPLEESTAVELVRRAVPSLTPAVIERLLIKSDRRPGPLKQFISRIACASVVSEDDVETLLQEDASPESERDFLSRAEQHLNRGRFIDAQKALAACPTAGSVGHAIAHARLSIGLGEAQHALDVLQAVHEEASLEPDSPLGLRYRLWLGRAEAGLLHHKAALKVLEPLKEMPNALGAEALTYYSFECFRLGDAAHAVQGLERAELRARECNNARVQGLALLSAGTLHMQARRNEEAHSCFEQALHAAEKASDASTLANVHSNLGVLHSLLGSIAHAMQAFEAAIDAGRRSGRLQVVRHSLANLANTDLFLGRYEKAQAGIDELTNQWTHLGAALQAQVLGLKADLKLGTGDTPGAIESYQECSHSYELLGQLEVAAEARLSGILIASAQSADELAALQAELTRSRTDLGESPRFVPLLCLTQSHLARLSRDATLARARLEQGLSQARINEQPEWIWRTLHARAELEDHLDRHSQARADRTEALKVLEQIAAPLPRDLREVYWNDPRRQAIRRHLDSDRNSSQSEEDAAFARTMTTGGSFHLPVKRTPLEAKLAQILEINRELLGEIDLEKLTQRVISCALEMLSAERGFVLLLKEDGELSAHTSRDQGGDTVRAEFSRSIARKVLANRQAVVSLDAQRDSTMGGYASVHQLMLQAVACVPINARGGEVIGALYLETRHQPGGAFERDLPIVQAFADQVGLAIATAQLVSENVARSRELTVANEQLQQTQARLTELLGERTQKLKLARRRLRDARNTLYGHFGYQGLVGTSAGMRRVYSLIDRVKDTDVPVLICGESGTGKEGASRAVHQASERSALPFLAINCGAIPEHLLESELFGHERGAFTGADKSRKGLLREAGKGTLLLDEIGEMPQKMQASLLRVLQERKVRPLGSTEELPVECRFLFATHRNLRAMVDEGRFREDLYYRIVVVEIHIPPLREHTDDIALLVDHFLGIFAARYKRERKSFTKAALRRLCEFHWPGNVRQLEHVLLNAYILSERSEVDEGDLEIPKPSGAAVVRRPDPPGESSPTASRKPSSSLNSHLRDEKSRITDALTACNWNRVRAAEMLGMPRRTFYRRLKQYDIQ